MTDERHDYRCKVTLLLDDVTEEEAHRFFTDGNEVEGGAPDSLIAMIEAPGKLEVQP